MPPVAELGTARILFFQPLTPPASSNSTTLPAAGLVRSSAFRRNPTALPRRAVLLALACCVLSFLRAAPSVPASPPRVLLLDAALADNAIVAVGERGTILRSTDQAATWTTVPSPTRATLTAIAFAPGAPSTSAAPASASPTTAPASAGWAAGHDALILATTDAGQTWTKQFQGENLQDSFLDALALDARHAIAVGAYGLYVVTVDAGKTWTRRKLSDDDFHFNRISRGPTGTLYLAGERGTLLRSIDQGSTWTPLRTSYEGSFYGILPLGERTLLAHGLTGHVFRSEDDGDTWSPVATPRPALLATAVRTRDNTILLAGQSRTLLVSRDDGRTLADASQPPASALAELIALPNGTLLAVGEAGAFLLDFPNSTASPTSAAPASSPVKPSPMSPSR